MANVKSFLTVAGRVLLAVESRVVGISPIIRALLPPDGAAQVQTVQSDLERIAGILVITESIGQSLNLLGTQKLNASA
jgi:hypothetical protein